MNWARFWWHIRSVWYECSLTSGGESYCPLYISYTRVEHLWPMRISRAENSVRSNLIRSISNTFVTSSAALYDIHVSTLMDIQNWMDAVVSVSFWSTSYTVLAFSVHVFHVADPSYFGRIHLNLLDWLVNEVVYAWPISDIISCIHRQFWRFMLLYMEHVLIFNNSATQSIVSCQYRSSSNPGTIISVGSCTLNIFLLHLPEESKPRYNFVELIKCTYKNRETAQAMLVMLGQTQCSLYHVAISWVEGTRSSSLRLHGRTLTGRSGE